MALDEQRLLDFMAEYALFFEELSLAQQQKLENVLSGYLHRIEHSLAAQQTLDKRRDNLENRRIALQQQLGVGDKTLRELIALVSPENRPELQGLYDWLEQSITDTKYYNNKALQTVNAKLKDIERRSAQPAAAPRTEVHPLTLHSKA